jgi:peptidoglycan hydrolase-like protein with peptidoglycan-binding domain
MDWKFSPITAAAALCLMASVPRSASAQNLSDVTGVARDTVNIICQFTDCRGNQQPRQQRQTVIQPGTRAQPTMSAAERRARAAQQAQRAADRQRGMEVQTALNGFGFDAGPADGDLGRRSQAAIAEYQAYMGYPSSGYLDDNQRGILVNSYRRLQAGEGARYPQVAAAEGARGLLKAFNDPNYIARYGVPGEVAPAPGGQPAYPGAEVAGGRSPGAVDPGAMMPAAQASARARPAPASDLSLGPLSLPSLQLTEAASVSMAQRCEIVELTTQSNQGPIQVANMSDPAQALSEQFCEARSYAIGVGENTSAKIRASEAELADACAQISKGMAPVRAALDSGTPDAVIAQAASVSGQLDPTSAATYGQICLGLGYRQDDPEMALSAGLLLVGAGYMPFGEVMGHHLREGFGVAPAAGAAAPWYNIALTALEGNAPPAFLPSKTRERAEVIRAAIGRDQAQVSGATMVPIAQRLTGQVPTTP